MLDFLGFTLLAVAGGFGGFYSIKRAKGRTWAHWIGFIIALAAGVLMVTTVVGAALTWTANWIPYIAGAAVVVFGLITVFDLADKRPDKGAILGALIVPSMLAIGITQIAQATTEIKDNGRDLQSTIEQRTGNGR
jgi:heme/copper-type cytochrome/quinol oxidase subunit 4